MYPKGIIYQKGVSKRSGIVKLKAPLGTRVAFTLFRGVGSGFVGFAIMAIIFTFGPIAKEELMYRFGNTPQVNLQQLKANEQKLVRQEAQNLGLDSSFSLYIPKINAKSIVVANVDPTKKQEYLDALTEGIAHTRGTYFPGQGKLVYMFAHSTDSPLNFSRYNAVFYLLKKLDKDDTIVVYFGDQKYEYQVTEKLTVKGNDTSWLTKEYDSETLVLQTCDPPGTTINRLLIVAKPLK